MISMTVLSAKVNYQRFCKSLSSETGEACIATQKIKGSFVKDHSGVTMKRVADTGSRFPHALCSSVEWTHTQLMPLLKTRRLVQSLSLVWGPLHCDLSCRFVAPAFQADASCTTKVAMVSESVNKEARALGTKWVFWIRAAWWNFLECERHSLSTVQYSNHEPHEALSTWKALVQLKGWLSYFILCKGK